MKISVVIACYNAARFITRTIDAILNQEGRNELFDLELIVVDDCSSDGTPDLIKTRKDLLFFQTPKNSGGPNKGRNIGIQASTGDYICIVDHDDEWLPDRIRTVLPYLKDAAIISTGYILVDIPKNVEMVRVGTSNSGFLHYHRNETFLKKLQKSKKCQNVYLGGLIYSSKLKNVLFEEVHGVVDYDWILRLFEGQASIECTAPTYKRYVDGSNLSLNERYRLLDYDYSLQTLQQYASRYPKEVKLGIQRLNGSMGRFYYLINEMETARSYFAKSERTLLTLAYWFTSFVGSSWVKKRFHIFG